MMRRLAARSSFELVCRRASELGWELKIEGEKVVLYKRDSVFIRYQRVDQLWVFLNKDAEEQGELNAEIVDNERDEVLHLPMKTRWYEMVERGEKPEEYRRGTPYWAARICRYGKECGRIHCGLREYCRTGVETDKKIVRFRYGYTGRTMDWELLNVRRGYGKPEWGAPKNEEVFIIRLGRRLG